MKNNLTIGPFDPSMHRIRSLVKKHESYREDGINLMASENYLSPQVREALSSDLAGRYLSDYYGGSSYAREIVDRTEELFRELFDVKHAIVEPLSGNICDLAVLFAFSEHNDKVAMLPYTAGGYPLGLEKFGRQRISLPNIKNTFEIDLSGSEKLYAEHEISLTILGASYIPFPHPVEEFRTMVDENSPYGIMVYDGSHVLGLLACGEFQSPLDEGAEVIIGSTHKSFYGPQGGVILTNSDEHHDRLREFMDVDTDTGIGLVDNPHVNRIAALGIAAEEMLEDQGYGKRVITNARDLATALQELGVPVKFAERGFTGSHQVFLDVTPEDALRLCHLLEKEGIFIDTTGRMGTAEVTHRGITDMDDIANRIAEHYTRL